MSIRIVHYLNQFFGQIGGEDKADTKPLARDGKVGPGMALEAALKGNAEIVGTVICGDSYFNENIDAASTEVLELIKGYNPDIVVAGPAFNAGRYGIACGAVAKKVVEELKIPSVTAMFPDNPGAELYKKDIYIIKTTNSAAGMRTAIPSMSRLILKLARGEEIGSPEEEGYIPRGIRKNVFKGASGSERALNMLIAKLKGAPYDTEYPMPAFDRVPPNAAIKDLSVTKIAVITSGGIVPKGNPDRIEASSASKYGKYDITGIGNLTSDHFETAHGGYDPVYANEDPDRVLPVDVLTDLVKEGIIGGLHNYYYSTVGNGTSVSNAKKFASEISKELIKDGVQAVVLTST